MNVDELLVELDELIRFRLIEFRTQVSAARKGIADCQEKMIAEKRKKYESIKRQQEERARDAFTTLCRNLKKHCISRVSAPNVSSWQNAYDQAVASFQREIANICRVTFINEEKENYIHKQNIPVAQSFSTKVQQWAMELNQKIAALTESVIDLLTTPIQHDYFDENAQTFTAIPVVKMLKSKDYIGSARIQAKNSRGKIIFDNSYPLFIELDVLNIISYSVAQNTPEQNADVYQNISNILGNICFQEMCRYFGKKNLFIHAWIPESQKKVSDRGFLKSLAFFQDFYPPGKKFVTTYGDRDIDSFTKTVAFPPANSYNLLIVFYAGDDERQRLKSAMEMAAVDTSNFLVVCVCEDRLIAELKNYKGNRDGANLVTPQDNTTDFKSKLISIVPEELTRFIYDKICRDDYSKYFVPSASVQCVRWEDEKSADFNALGLRNLLQQPQQPIEGEIMVEVGTLKGYPYYWRYFGGKVPPNAYVHGKTGTGKSFWINDFIYNVASKYSPDDAVFYLCGFKGGADYVDVCRLPHVKFAVFSLSEIRHFYEMMLYDLMKENQIRAKNWDRIKEINNKYQRNFSLDIDGYHSAAKELPEENLSALPMIFFIIDEARPLFTSRSFCKLVDPFINLFTKCRSTGIFLILASQHDKISDNDYRDFISFDLSLNPPDNAIYGDSKLYRSISQFPYGTGTSLKLDTKDKISSNSGKEKIKQEFSDKIENVVKLYSHSPSSSYSRFYFEDGSLPSLESISSLKNQIQDVLNASTPTCLRIYLGIFFGSRKGEEIKSLREPYAFSLDSSKSQESAKNLLIIDDANRDTPTYNSFWMSFMMSVLLQTDAKVRCCMFDFDKDNKETLQTNLEAIPKNVNTDASISVSDSFEEMLTTLSLWELSAKNKQKKQANSFFIITVNLDNLENAFENYLETQEERIDSLGSAPAQSAEINPTEYSDADIVVSEEDLAKMAEKIKERKDVWRKSIDLSSAQPAEVNPTEYSDADIVVSEEDLVKMTEKIKKENAENHRTSASSDKVKMQEQYEKSESGRMTFSAPEMTRKPPLESYKDFCKYFSDLLTKIQGSNKSGCFVFLQSSGKINENILHDEDFGKLRFIGFPCSENLLGPLRNLPRKGDNSFIKNAGVYYGSINELKSADSVDSSSEPFLPVEVESLRKLALSLGRV